MAEIDWNVSEMRKSNTGACASFCKLRIIFIANGPHIPGGRNKEVSEGVIYNGDGTTNHQVL